MVITENPLLITIYTHNIYGIIVYIMVINKGYIHYNNHIYS